VVRPAPTTTQIDPNVPVELTAGPLQAVFYRGDLRYVAVRWQDNEVLRRVYVAVRDTSWGTVEPSLANLSVEQCDDGSGFRIEYDAEHRRGEIDFAWHATIVGECRRLDDGQSELELRFEMDGTARSPFWTNRTGLCVHHPPPRDEGGEACCVEHTDSSWERPTFPGLVSPNQPFTNVRWISHRAASVTFDGEVFETEDQRNWTDSSFKTYCRPLSLPFPYRLEAGQKVRHAVILKASMSPSEPATMCPGRSVVPIRIDPRDSRALPALGIRRGAAGRELIESERHALRALNLAHLRADVCLDRNDWQQELCFACADSAALGLPLELALHVGDGADAALGLAVQELSRRRPDVCRVIVYESTRPVTSLAVGAAARRHLAPVYPRVPVGGGTAGSFAELNRNRPPQGAPFNLLAWPANPQVHASDDLSLIENVAAQGDTVRTARAFAPECRLCVGPVTLHRVPDKFAAGAGGAGSKEEVLGDPRQEGALGAAWTLGSIRTLADAGADAVTYYESVGPFGVMPEVADRRYPLYQVLADVGEFAGGEVLAADGNDPLGACALALRKDGRLRLLVANLHWRPRAFRLEPIAGYEPVNGPPLPLEAQWPPYHVARLDFAQDSNTLRT